MTSTALNNALPAHPPDAVPIAPGAPGSAVQVVDELADVVAIFTPGVQVCVYRRAPIKPLGAALAQAAAGTLTGFRRVIDVNQPGPALPLLPEPLIAAGAAQELGFLTEVYAELLGCDRIGLRLEVLHRPMCPRWHRDHNGIRLLCTWLGPGTEWLDDTAAPVAQPSQIPASAPPSGQAAPFDLVLLKGSLWQGNAGRGAIHRSPDPGRGAPDHARCLVALDALWD